ncbi:MAG: tRNA-dihydrouridine synthase family protein [Spirochaetes bacterium]|nr:tRNA-dihydrouridine synthase family protein [Spirochaetota bacterium]
MLPFKRGALILAPMVGITNRAFRTLVSELGKPDYAFTEMASAEAFAAKAQYEEYYTDPQPEPRATSLQFFARGPEALAAACALAAARPTESRPAGIDLNFGCSAPHIRRAGGGSAWSSDRKGAVELVASARAAWDGPLSVKLRMGPDEDYDRLLTFCLALASAGLDFLTLHPRTDRQKFKGKARLEIAGMLAADLPIPVVASGDIIDAGTAHGLMEGKGVCAVMIGREAVRRPWIFALLKSELEGLPRPAPFDRFAIAERFLGLADSLLPPPWRKETARRFFGYFCEGWSFSHHITYSLINAPDPGAALENLKTYFEQVPQDRFTL